MTVEPLLTALLPLVTDLSVDLPETERYRRLLGALRDLLPCDAAALLRLDGDSLVPLAVDGLLPDTLERRFKVSDHPRFAALLGQLHPLCFASDRSMPNPYDGLVEGAEGNLCVHDCMGCLLLVDERPWGLLTLDALDAGRFRAQELAALQAFASLAAATVTVARRIAHLADRAEAEQRRAQAYRLTQPSAPTLIGQSEAHQRLLDEIASVGATELAVLVSGETGVGKELVARAVHRASRRADRPLISLNCAALPETRVESELFGHVGGAFTGALSERPGKFELAHGGTLLLDEVGELPLPVQAKLLRVLQDGHLRRLSSDREHPVDVRLIATTNRDLSEAVCQGRFRADLYHRLCVYSLQVPALRDRGRDVLTLAGTFLEQNRARLGVRGLRLDTLAQAALLAYAWPGNVRELEHLIGRSALRALGRQPRHDSVLTLTVHDLDLSDAPASPEALHGDVPVSAKTFAAQADCTAAGPLRDRLDAYQRQVIEACLLRYGGNSAAAARELGLDRANLSRLARRLGLR